MAQPTRIPPPPKFTNTATSDVIQGVTVADPYRGLEDADDPKVRAWSDAENARTRGYLDPLPGREAVAAKITRLIKDSSPVMAALQARGPFVFGLYFDPNVQQPTLVTLNAMADPSSRRSLVDPNAIDPSGHTAIDWYVASPDGTRVAVSMSKNGSEEGTLHIYDVATLKEIETPIAGVQYPIAGGALAWTADSGGFWYTRYPDAGAPASEQHFNQRLFLHRLGANVAADRLVLGPQQSLPRTAEIYLDGSQGATAVLASVELGDGGEYQHYVLEPDGTATRISRYADKVIGGAVIGRDGAVYAVSRLDAPMGKILKLVAPYAGEFATAKVIVPERRDAAIIDGGEFGHPLTISGDRLFVTRIAGGLNEVSLYDFSGGHAANLATPPVAAVDEVDGLPGGDVLFRVSTYLEPSIFMRWRSVDASVSRTALAATSPITFEDTQVTRILATSKDGTKVPISIISRKDAKLDGSNPVLLYGYGGYGVSQTRSFAGTRARIWLDAGGVYAEANIRGGGEFGERWHQEGMLTKKQNAFDDFDAAAEEMIRLRYTSHAKLALQGISNGGLLMGAMITQHPTLARAVVSQVGVYDMLRLELDPNGAFNVTEFGSVKNLEQFKALYAYSPYHNVRQETAYPAVLMMTGATDGRVNPMQSRKFTAALQAATASDRPILLRTTTKAGHGIGSSLDEIIAEATDKDMFLFDQLGMNISDAAR